MKNKQSFDLLVAKGTHVGKKRQDSPNQDFVALREPTSQEQLDLSGRIFVVADGVGGESKGNLASEFAAQAVMRAYYNHTNLAPEARLTTAIRQASKQLFEKTVNTNWRMATTIVVAVILHDTLYVANVGDSRAYLARRGQLQQLTRDHNIVGELVRDGQISEEEALHAKAKNRLTRSVGGESDVHVDTFSMPLQTGDRVFLCTDGLTRYTLNADINKLLQAEGGKVVKSAINYAIRRGGADNVTALLVEVGEISSNPKVLPFASQVYEEHPTIIQRPKSWLKFIAMILIGLIGVMVYLYIRGDLVGIPPAGEDSSSATAIDLSGALPSDQAEPTSSTPEPTEIVDPLQNEVPDNGTSDVSPSETGGSAASGERQVCSGEDCICLQYISQGDLISEIYGRYDGEASKPEEYSTYSYESSDMSFMFSWAGMVTNDYRPDIWVKVEGITSQEQCQKGNMYADKPGQWLAEPPMPPNGN